MSRSSESALPPGVPLDLMAEFTGIFSASASEVIQNLFPLRESHFKVCGTEETHEGTPKETLLLIRHQLCGSSVVVAGGPDTARGWVPNRKESGASGRQDEILLRKEFGQRRAILFHIAESMFKTL
ncbi:hypothetical protein B0H11DRAFT_1923656 [Mycena galericulata]|nr:hypothetical protein B0H11DRAFT_1923656 [Mycena galericulata]